MNKKILELTEKLENKKSEMRELLANKDLEGAAALKPEVENLKTELELAKVAFEEAQEGMVQSGTPVSSNGREQTAVTEFLNFARGRAYDNAMVSKEDESGGYTVPEDIQTQVEQWLEAEDSLQPLIRVSPVSTETGARTFQKRSSGYITGFDTVEELAEITMAQTPQFERMKYAVKKFANRFIASNEVLSDSDAALRTIMVEWIGNMSRVLRNAAIRVVLDQKAKTPITCPDDIKKAMNVTLDPAFRNRTVVVTNQDGWHVMDTWKFDDGRYMLEDDIQLGTSRRILGRRLVVISNNDLPSVDGLAPVIIGDLKEGVQLFDRKALAVRASDTAGKAWEHDAVEWRAIQRFDVVMRDEHAFVYGQIDVGNATGLMAGLAAMAPMTTIQEAATVEAMAAPEKKGK